jgi:hypothetical protein
MKLEDVYVAFGGDTADLRRELKMLDGAMRDSQGVTANALKSIEGSMSLLRNGLAAIGVGLSAGAIVSGVTSIIKSMDDLADTAQLLSVSAESLQVFRLAAEANAGSADALDKGLRELVKTIGEARTGSQTAAEAFRKLGLDELVAKGAPVEAVMLAAASAIARIEDPTQKTEAAISLLGKSGTDLVGVLNLGESGLRSFGEEARRTGQIVNDETVAQLAAAQDTINKATTQIANFSTMALAGVFDFANGVLSGLTRFARDVRILLGGVSTSEDANVQQMYAGLDNIKQRLEGAKRSLSIQSAAGLGDVIIGDTKKTIAKLETELGAAKERLASKIARNSGADAPSEIAPAKLVYTPLTSPRASGGGAKPKKAQARIGPNDQPDYGFELLRDAAQEAKKYDDELNQLAETMRGRFGPEIDAFAEAQANLNTLLAAGKIDISEYNEMLGRAAEASRDAKDWIDQAFDGAADSIGAALAGTKSWDAALKDVKASVLELATQELALKPLKETLSNIFAAVRKDSGSWFGGILDGLDIFGRAGGGPVNAGQPYRVGETGPEYFVPTVPGRIQRGGGSGGAVAVTVDLRGNTSDKELERKLQASAAASYQAAYGAVRRDFSSMLSTHQARRG